VIILKRIPVENHLMTLVLLLIGMFLLSLILKRRKEIYTNQIQDDYNIRTTFVELDTYSNPLCLVCNGYNYFIFFQKLGQFLEFPILNESSIILIASYNIAIDKINSNLLHFFFNTKSTSSSTSGWQHID
jgi:hypothetical protein